ncbi:ORF-68 [Catopsilia pomona nucleopolyhedrovirus]|uniref:ORF-68 n=1 Tax=Catopsilia pomona nucleopolyhedrovirus TaxID=1850906 RepID=A0A172WZD9_9ABAC|nr:ORF-68 [Catopsilia pomona nucleopolyhedrovirus]ANF29716.1 ORF-68 [Catopsilia pomona nucleopolyhedrovirus]
MFFSNESTIGGVVNNDNNNVYDHIKGILYLNEPLLPSQFVMKLKCTAYVQDGNQVDHIDSSALKQINNLCQKINASDNLYFQPDCAQRQNGADNYRTIYANSDEYTVDGLKLKTNYIKYYKVLKIIVGFVIVCISKELNVKEYEHVYTLARQLYELLRGLFIDEPFKLWLERNVDTFDEKTIMERLRRELKILLADKDKLKRHTLQHLITDLLNRNLANVCDGNLTEYNIATAHDDGNEHIYYKPSCIVDTYNCCNIHFIDSAADADANNSNSDDNHQC